MTTGTDIALLFPGQGSQTPDMRDDVAHELPDLLEHCIELVGEDPFERVDESTRFAQPAIFCAGIAGWTRSTSSPPWPPATRSASSARCRRRRPELRRRAPPRRAARPPDGRGRRPRLDARAARRHARRREAIAAAADVTVANDNAPGQVVLSGDRDKLAEAEEAAREYGVRAMPLDVAGAFHSPAMEPAVAPFRAALDEVELGDAALHRLLVLHRRAVHRRARRAHFGAHPPRAAGARRSRR